MSKLVDVTNARYSARFDRQLLDKMVDVGDPLADRATAALQRASQDAARRGEATQSKGAAGGQIERLRALRAEGVAEAEAFFAAAESRPSWYNAEAIERGQNLAASFASFYGLSLTHSLFAGGLFPRAALVTGATGRLGSDPNRRIQETAAFVAAVLQPDGLEPGSLGFDTAVRVRLLHGAIRSWTTENDVFSAGYVGVPIDQTMLAMTNGLFSYLNLRSLRRLGVTISADDEIAHHHLWRYIGHLLGIDQRVLTDTPQAEAELWEALVAHQAMPEVMGPDFLNHAVEGVARVVPNGKKAKGLIRELLLYLSGPDWFGVDEPIPSASPLRRALQAAGLVGSGIHRFVPRADGVLAARGRRELSDAVNTARQHDYGVKVARPDDRRQQEAEEALMVRHLEGVRCHFDDPTTQAGAPGTAGAEDRTVSIRALDRGALTLSRQLNKRPWLAEASLSRTDWGNPFAEGSADNPYLVYEKMRAQGPVAWSPIYRQWFVTGLDEGKELLNSPNLTATSQIRLVLACEPHRSASAVSREVASYFLLFLDPPLHTRLRKLVSKAFTVRQISRLEEATERRAHALLDRLEQQMEAGAPVDVFEAFNQPLPIEIIAELLGIDEADLPFTQKLSLALTEFLDPLSSSDAFDELDLTLQEGVRFFDQLIERRRAEPTDDLISAMVAVRGDDDNSDGTGGDTGDGGDRFEPIEIISLAMFLMFAGHETTSGVMGTALVGLQRFRDQRDLLVREPDLWPRAVEEFLRFDSALQLDPRTANCDFLFGDHLIRKGQNVVIVLGGANRDPRHFDAPDELRIDRPDVRSLVFGHGPHLCLGAALARMELRVGLRAFLDRFPDYQLDLDQVEWKQHPILRGPVRLPLANV